MIAALAALALAAPAAASTHRDLPLEVLEAGEVEYDVGLKRGRATGGVVLRRGLVTLRAQSALYDEQTGEVDASGGVLLLEPGRALAASAMHAVLDGPYEAHDVVAFLKDAPLDLSRCRTVADVRAAGHGRVEVGGAVLHGVSGAEGDPFQVERARITLCDCGGGPPSWEIRSRHASVTPGKGAFLTLPIIYITPRFLFLHTPVPVMVLPVLYLPLGDRQSGLLVPSLELGGVSGVSVAEPLYLTLGRSWDATITPSWSFGPGASGVNAAPGGAHGVKGLGAEVEVRWTPAEGTSGTFRLFEHKSEIQAWPTGIYRPAGMNRVAIALTHDQRLSDATYLKVEAGLVGDPLYLIDFTGDALLRAADYRRSAVALEHRRDDVVLEADAAYHLPVNVGFLNSGRPTAAPFGLFGGGLDSFHRIPSASATLLPVAVAGPLRLSGQVGVARFAPLRGPTGDEGLDQIGPGERGWGANVGDAGENDGRWQVGERLAATRASARAELRAPFFVGDALALEPWLSGTALGYSFEADQGTQANAWAVGGLRASTALARDLGSGAGRLLHVIEPSVELRAGTPWAGPNLPAFAYDELDVARPPAPPPPGPGTPAVRPQRTLTAEPGAFQQVRLAVRNRLLAPAGPLSRSAAELTVGIDGDLGRGKLSETWAQTSFQAGRFLANAEARLYAFGAGRPADVPLPPRRSWLDQFTELRGDVHVYDARADEAHVTLTAVGPGGSPRLLGGLEPLFDPRAAAVDAVAIATAGARARIVGATIAYDAFINARPFAAPLCAGKTAEPHVFQQVASLVWDSPCRCWKAGVVAVLNECDARPRLSFIIDLSSITQRRPTF